MEDKKKLLEKFLAGTCTKEELGQVNKMDKVERGEILFELMEQREEYELSKMPATDAKIKQWVRAKKMELTNYTVASKSPHRRPFLTRSVLHWGSLAAVFAGVIILSGVFLWNNHNDLGLLGGKEQAVAYAELSNLDGIPELHQLPDGTQIWLAAGSTLKYPEQFSEKHRDVELTGEAFFDVARDEARPFTIRTGDMQTRVLGTSFKITAFAGQEQEVSVATGKVSVSSNGQELAKLTRGLQVRRNPQTGETTRAEIDPTILEEWKAGKLIFNKLPMSAVAEQLEKRYNIKIEFSDPQIATHHVRGTFGPEESVSAILRKLCMIGHFQYKSTNDKQYTIY